MACTDGGVPFPPSREEVLNDKVPIPMLCAMLAAGALTERVAASINWAEAGITQAEFQEWWANHRRRDEERKAREVRQTLPPGKYEVREEVTHQDRHWFVTMISMSGGVQRVTMVTADNREPTRKETFVVRKS